MLPLLSPSYGAITLCVTQTLNIALLTISLSSASSLSNEWSEDPGSFISQPLQLWIADDNSIGLPIFLRAETRVSVHCSRVYFRIGL